MINPEVTRRLAEIDTAAHALAAMVPALPDPKPRVSIHGGTALEGAGRFIVRVTSDIPFPDGVSFRVQTFLTGSASEEDFTPIDTWITPVVGAMEAQGEVPIKQDLIDESDEVFEVWITDVSRDDNGNPELEIAVQKAFVTVIDDDEPAPAPGTPPKLFANPAALMPMMSGANAANGIYVQPDFEIVAPGRVKLFTVFKDKYQGNKLGSPVVLRYIVNGRRMARVTADPNVFSMDPEGHDKRHGELVIDWPHNGVFDLTVRLIEGQTSFMHVEGSDIQIGPYDGRPLNVPAHGSGFQSNRFRKPIADYVRWAGGTKHPPLPGKPRSVKLVPGLTQSGRDPKIGYSISNYVIETWTQHVSSLYDTEPELQQSRSGVPVARHRIWSDGHNASVIAPRSRLKVERNGPRLANMVDPNSTVRFTHGTLAWCISLRGTVSVIDLATGGKEAVCGRVFREDTLPLEYGKHTQAEVDAANYEYVGDAPAETDLAYDAPHDIHPCPWNEDFEAIFLDSFNGRGYHVDRSVKPAKVTKIFEGFDRPYALVVYPDRRVRFCCTPTQQNQLNSGIFELAADWKSVRKVLGLGTPADGDNRAIRPFWMCQFEPGYELFWEHTTGRIKKLNIATGEAKFWAQGLHLPDAWGMIVCDINGSIGEPYDVWMIGSNTNPGNTQFKRYDRNGKEYPGTFLQVSIGTAPQGPCLYFFDSPMHYGWWLAIHPVFGLCGMQGYGNIGIIFARIAANDDPKPVYDHPSMGWGRGAYDLGTIPGFPYDLRPSGTALRGRTGQSFMPGVRSVSAALEGKSQAEALQWWRDGADGTVKRPEFDGKAGEKLYYFLGYLRDDIPHGHKAPADTKPAMPKILTWSKQRNADGSVSVSFTTDKPVWSCLSDFRSSVAANSYSTTHSLRTDQDCGPLVTVRLYGLDGSEGQTESVAA